MLCVVFVVGRTRGPSQKWIRQHTAVFAASAHRASALQWERQVRVLEEENLRLKSTVHELRKQLAVVTGERDALHDLHNAQQKTVAMAKLFVREFGSGELGRALGPFCVLHMTRVNPSWREQMATRWTRCCDSHDPTTNILLSATCACLWLAWEHDCQGIRIQFQFAGQRRLRWRPPPFKLLLCPVRQWWSSRTR